MKWRFAAITAALVAVSCFAGAPAFAQAPVCQTAICTAEEVGPFMQGIAKSCGDVGTCNLCDIEIVIVNVGNWILGIVGALVLLFYVWGGIQMLASGSGASSVKAGKESIKTATIGLVIVFLAYAGVHTIAQALGISVTGGTCAETVGKSPNVGGAYSPCETAADIGKQCGLNKQCIDFGDGTPSCNTRCFIDHGQQGFTCKDTTSWSSADRSGASCIANLCDGGDAQLCCTDRPAASASASGPCKVSNADGSCTIKTTQGINAGADAALCSSTYASYPACPGTSPAPVTPPAGGGATPPPAAPTQCFITYKDQTKTPDYQPGKINGAGCGNAYCASLNASTACLGSDCVTCP